MNDLDEHDMWIEERLRSVDLLPVPPGDLAGIKRRVRHRRIGRTVAASAAAFLVVAGFAMAATSHGDGPNTSVATDELAAASVPVSQPPTSTGDYLTDWQNNVPSHVGTSKAEGTILPREADTMDYEVFEYAEAHGFTGSDQIPPDLADALRVVRAIDVRNPDGTVIGKFTTEYIPLAQYPARRTAALEVIDHFEAPN